MSDERGVTAHPAPLEVPAGLAQRIAAAAQPRRCDGCRWWRSTDRVTQEPGRPDWGVCGRMEPTLEERLPSWAVGGPRIVTVPLDPAAKAMATWHGGYPNDVYTAPDFGCVMWEPSR